MTNRRSNPLRTILLIMILIFMIITILGSFGIVDTVALDDSLEDIGIGRVFGTVPLPTETAFPSVAPSGPEPENGDWWSVYFTNPGVEENYIAANLIDLIDNAEKTIHIASFEFNLDDVAEALIAAYQRGVEVLWVTDDEHGIEADEEEGHGQFAMLEDAGIEIKDDHRSALMHNKFWVFDGQVVWTGSTNITENGTMLNNNNVIVVEAPPVAEIYEREFQEMWTLEEFGPRSTSTLDQQSVVVDQTPIVVLFGAEDDVALHLAELLAGAQNSIRFMAFSFTHDDMGGTVLSRAESGVDVAGIFETRGSETEYSELPGMFCSGLAVRQDGNPRTFHHKVLIIDEHIVVTGSFNFSQNANDSNDENVIIVDNPEIAAQYLAEFDRRWQEAQVPDADEFSCP